MVVGVAAAFFTLLALPAEPTAAELISGCLKLYDKPGVARLEMKMVATSPNGVTRLNVKSAAQTGADGAVQRGRAELAIESGAGGKLISQSLVHIDDGKQAGMFRLKEKKYNVGVRHPDRVSALLRAMLGQFSQMAPKAKVTKTQSNGKSVWVLSGTSGQTSASIQLLEKDLRFLQMKITSKGAPGGSSILSMVSQSFGGTLSENETNISIPKGFKKDPSIDPSSPALN